MKKLLSLMVILVLGLALVGCKKDNNETTTSDNTTTQADDILPILSVAPTDVTIMYGEDYDLMTGVEATDNIDGDITDSVEIDNGGFDNETPGQYVITYTVEDSSGNSQTASRNITVQERMAAVVIDGEKFAMAYNPILHPKNLMGTGAVDANGNTIDNPWHFDISKVSVFTKDYFDFLYTNYSDRLYAGWSNIAVTDADGEIVLLRDHNCNEYTEEGSEVCTVNNEWSNGTVDNDYKNTYGGLANITVPDGGHVIVFINDGVNESDSPRAFGDPLMGGGVGLGKEVTFQDPEVVVDHENNQLPVISIPEETTNLLVGDTFDVMENVSVTDNEDSNVTLETTIKKFDGTTYVEVNEVTTTEESIYIVEYSAAYDETRDIYVRRQIVVATEAPVEEDKYITFNGQDLLVQYNTSEWPTYYSLSGGQLYTKDFWENTIDQTQLVYINEGNMYKNGLIIVLNQFGKIIEIRDDQNETEFTLENPEGVAATDWTKEQPTNNLVVPENGFVLAYYTLTNAYKAFVHSSDSPQTGAGTTDVNAIGQKVSGEWFADSITVGDKELYIVENPANWAYYYNIYGGHLYTKDFFETIDQSQLVDITPGKMYQWSLVIVLNQFGEVIEIRDGLSSTEFNADNPAGVAAADWTAQTPTANLVIPENGFVLGFTGDYRTEGYKTFVHSSGDHQTYGGTTDVNMVGEVVEGKWFTDFITVSDEKVAVTVNPTDWATYYNVPYGHLYTKAYWDTIDQSQLVSIDDGCMYQWGLIVVFDEIGKVVEIRDAQTVTEFTEENPAGVAATSWAGNTPTANLNVPENGFVLAYYLNLEDGYKAFVHTSGDHNVGGGATDVNAIGTTVTVPVID